MENARASEALEELLPAMYPWARRLALLLCGDADAAQDLVQEALVEALRRPPVPLSTATVQAWLRTVILRMHLRRRRRLVREARTILLLRRERTPVRPALSEPTERVLAALAKLAPRQRACLILRYLEDLPEGKIAELLGVREGTVKAHLAQGREKLRQSLRR